MQPLIEAQALSRHYELGGQRFDALREVSLTVQAGEFVAITGASGSGKSSLLNLIGALDRPSSGRLIIQGQSLGELSEPQLAQFRNRTLGFVFQQFQLLQRASVLHNVALPLLYAGEARRTREARAMALLTRLGLAEHAAKLPTQLSGGQQQRVAIARALVCNAPLLLADEPTGALDSATGAAVMSLLRELNQQDGRTVLLVTHDPGIAAACPRRLRFADGRLVSDERSSQSQEALA
jgi:putative ABC transport system ATP-binding protein